MAAPQGEVEAYHNFAAVEVDILAYWDKIQAFETSLKLSEGRKEYSFYDGPPFATGLPHYGHLLAGTIKDTVTRYAHQVGHHVVRRFGWDTHGLPVEFEIDQQLGIKDREQVLAMGIDKYNAACRGIVTRYVKEWEATVKRIGRWIDFKNDYKTLDPWFMESVWWVFKQIYDKDLVYRGYKVMPFSTACGTPLSNFEAGQNYQDVHDPAVVVSFPVRGQPDVNLLAWTTTPWTLPSNLALCVHADLDYAKIRDKKSGKVYVLAEARLVQLYPKINNEKLSDKQKAELRAESFELLDKCKGSALVGLQYEPLFPYFDTWEGAFRVVSDSYVTADSGTGIVHQAPAFGEDDYRVCIAHNVVKKGVDLPCPVDMNGKFTLPVTDFLGQHVKKADDDICRVLKAAGRLVEKSTYIHSYPFCWRSDTPLIYKAVPSWFVKVESVKEHLLVNNQQTYWVPNFVKEGRFHNWLADARDWAISRNRFWGTPIPLWVSEDFEERVAVGSVEELEKLSGVKVTDLHRENIDHITIPSKQGKGVLRRVDEVFDCWFESGSMPYAQVHYPFENRDRFESNFPADFIAEGIDQTRGWFYTLMVLSTCLFNKPPFKNLIVNGLVLAEDGKKMSKRLKNYPPPTEILAEQGADALRLYLISSPVVRAENLRFKKDGVQGMIKDVFHPWVNAFRFFQQNCERLAHGGLPFTPSQTKAHASTNVTDVWIQASLQGLIKFVHDEMKAYHLYTVTPRLLQFIEYLTNWYVRMNRARLKGAEGEEESVIGLSVLYDVLLNMAVLMAPFTPFLTEFLYQHLRKLHPNYGQESLPPDAIGRADSVHYLMLPTYEESRLDPACEAKMETLRTVIELGRIVRERNNIGLKTPVKEVIVVCREKDRLAQLESVSSYALQELNVWKLNMSTDELQWSVLKAVANFKVLGPRLGKDVSKVKAALAALSVDQLVAYQKTNKLEVGGHVLEGDDLFIRKEFKGAGDRYQAETSSDGSLLVILDVTQDEEVLAQARAREIMNRVQKLRKKAGLKLTDRVEVYVEESQGAGIMAAVKTNRDLVVNTLRVVPLPVEAMPKHAVKLAVGSDSIGTAEVTVYLTRPCVSLNSDSVLSKAGGDSEVAQALEGYVASCDYERLKTNGQSVSLTCEGKTVVLKQGVDFFLTGLERVLALDPKGYAWAKSG